MKKWKTKPKRVRVRVACNATFQYTCEKNATYVGEGVVLREGRVAHAPKVPLGLVHLDVHLHRTHHACTTTPHHD
jgi:hypothetical protein